MSMEAAADTLRAWALDEALKARVMADPTLARAASAVSRRYVAGSELEDVLTAANDRAARGHPISIELVGESVRDERVARSETDQILKLVAAVGAVGLDSTISFDLSHVGAVVSRELGLSNATEIVRAAESFDLRVMFSAEGSDRTDLILGLYDELARSHANVGITLQARLHRTPDDLARVSRHPGTVRLVKGAFLEPEDVAYPRNSAALERAYRKLAATLIDMPHPLSIATHDDELVDSLLREQGDQLRAAHVEFETLMGLGDALLARLRSADYRTREYLVYGSEWWLYVLNRISEQPERIFQALADLRGFGG